MPRRGAAPRPAPAAAGATLCCLDDACLLNIFRQLTPLPDLFAVSAVCKRWRAVASDRRLWLVVESPDAASRAPAQEGDATSAAAWGGARHHRFPTFAAAVAASLPGQRIFLEPGAHAAADVALRWPLCVAGAPGCELRVPAGVPRGVSVHAHCRLADVAVTALGTGAYCVEHVGGKLLLERCALLCADVAEHPLAHLGAPILSRVPRGAGAGGVLTVVQTRCEGGGAAVRCAGGARLAAVRVIYASRTAAFWFNVVPDEAATDAQLPHVVPLTAAPPPKALRALPAAA